MDHDITIYLVLFGSEAFGLASSLFDDLKSYVDDHYVAEKKKKEYGPGPHFRRRFENYIREETFEDEEREVAPDSMMTGAAASMDMFVSCDEAPTAARIDGGLKEFLEQHESTFSEFLLDLLKERYGKDSEVYKRAEISKQLFSNGFSVIRMMMSDSYCRLIREHIRQLFFQQYPAVNQHAQPRE